jgi:hypothetical protein
VYRSTVSGGPFTKVNSLTSAATSFTDNAMQSGQYYYVVTAVNSSSMESVYSGEAAALIP